MKSYTVTIQPMANHVVSLNWQASTSQNVAGYNVYRSPDGATWKKINVSLTASTLYSDSTVSNGSTYYYAVTAQDILRVAGKYLKPENVMVIVADLKQTKIQ